MMNIFVNALGASTASGLTYLHNVLPHLAAHQNIHTTVAVSPRLRTKFLPSGNVGFADLPELHGTVRRFWFEQMQLPKLLRQAQADVLISAGNFAVRKSPVPQILLSGNSLYTSADFHRDLLSRGDYRMWLDTRVRAVFARKSVAWSDYTVAPSQVFADELRRWTGKPAVSIRHGFDRDIFFFDDSPLPPDIKSKLDSANGDLKLLHVSHYNYFRNFETLFRAIPLIRERLASRRVRLFLTCKLEDGQNPGSYRTGSACSLVKQLGIDQEVLELGAVPYQQLHHVYRSCDLYVTASYAETFAHPLIEAQSCGLKIIASDIPVHHEVCGGNALYFARFSPQDLATQVIEAAASDQSLGRSGISAPFSWAQHVEKIIGLAETLVRRRSTD